jgi:hypothetical protein
VSGAKQVDAIYKPNQGERPLWDFKPGTLSLRERAAFLVSELFDWKFVPPTVLRDGPHGFGSIQHFVDHDPNNHYLTFRDDYRPQAQSIALFDVLINNADRKSGHVLRGNDGQLWVIDHGVCFHSDYKLKSVIWDFAGDSIPKHLLADLERVQANLYIDKDPNWNELEQLLSANEVIALKSRLDLLIKSARYPKPGPGRHYPWPLI